MIRRKSLGLKLSSVLVILIFASGCFDIEGKNPLPLEHRTVYTTSGYTLGACQDNLDKLAGAPVQMTSHAGSPFLWLYLGLLPVYTCQGFVEMPPAAGNPPKTS